MKELIMTDFDTHYKEIIFGEEDNAKIKANNFLHLLTDLVIEQHGKFAQHEQKEKELVS